MKEQIENRLFRISDYFDNNILFKAVRQGMVMMIPLLVSNSVALMLSSIPFSGYQHFWIYSERVRGLFFYRAGTHDMF